MGEARNDTALFHPSLHHLLIDVNEVRPHPRNARNGDLDVIAESITVNGCYRPLIAQRSTGYILAGNHTYAALLGLGCERVPVLWHDVDDQVATRIMLADNRTADLGGYDDGLLMDLLDDLASHDSLLGTGYDAADLADLHKLLEDDARIEPQSPEYGWPVLHFRVSPATRAAFFALTDQNMSDTDRFLALLRKAGWTGTP